MTVLRRAPESPQRSEPLAAGRTGSSTVPEHVERWKWLLGTNHWDKPLLRRLNWLHIPLLFGAPALALYGLWTTQFYWQTWVFAYVYYFLTGIGITGGYHRLFAHRAYQACDAVKLAMVLFGTGAFEGSVRWWSRDHRAHHRFVDTEQDPYAVHNGFWYAHIGWMLVKQDKSKIGRVDISDLDSDPMLRFQHRYYLPLALIMAYVVPSVVAGLLWGDYRGGFFVAGVLRLVFVHHSTFCVNSLAHYTGEATYSDQHSAKNSIITALVTLGEGYHNFHHEFPADYRNGVRWYQYDPTKVVIWLLSLVGLVWDLKRFPTNEIQKGNVQMKQKWLDAERATLDWGPADDTLPVMTAEELRAAAEGGRAVVAVMGYVLDVSEFLQEHPGGRAVIKPFLGKDATAAFLGGVYKHSNAAQNRTQSLRVAKLAV